jgi:hypothetical protein
MAKPAPIFIGELYLGLFTELGNLHDDVKRNVQQEQPGGRISKHHAGTD